jgi:hypothetical protein
VEGAAGSPRGGGSTCGAGEKVTQLCSETAGGGVLNSRRQQYRSLAPRGERERKVGLGSNRRKEAELAAHQEGEHRQRIGGNRRGATSSSIRGL